MKFVFFILRTLIELTFFIMITFTIECILHKKIYIPLPVHWHFIMNPSLGAWIIYETVTYFLMKKILIKLYIIYALICIPLFAFLGFYLYLVPYSLFW